MSRVAFALIIAATLALPRAALAQDAAADTQVRSFALPPLQELQATRQRPLFSPGRKPDAQIAARPDAPVVEEAAGAQPFDLTGIVMGADRAIAILRNRETQETVHLRQGEAAEEWSVEEIASRYVVLRNEDRQVRLQLFEEKPGGAAAPPTERPNPVHNLDSAPPRPQPAAQSQKRRPNTRPPAPRRP
jgi:general secretion pathway protein N